LIIRTATCALVVLGLVCGCGRATPPTSKSGGVVTPAPAESTVRVDRDSGEGAADVVRSYYRAINARHFDEAYRLWSRDGAASGKSLAAFRDGFSRAFFAR